MKKIKYIIIPNNNKNTNKAPSTRPKHPRRRRLPPGSSTKHGSTFPAKQTNARTDPPPPPAAVEELRQSFFSGGGMVELRWAPTEGAQMYNVTLFADATLASVRRAEMISRES